MSIDRRARMKVLIRDVLNDYHSRALNRSSALICISNILTAYRDNKPLTRDASYYFPLWFRALAWSENRTFIKLYKPDKHFTGSSKERRSVVHSIQALAPDSIPAAVAEALNAEPIEPLLLPHVLGACEVPGENALSDRQAFKTVKLARGAGPRPANETQTSTRADNPIASPERIPTAPGLLIEGTMTLHLEQTEQYAPADSRPRSKAAKSYYQGKTLIYVKFGEEHHVVNGHWEEYIKLRREQPKVVIIHATQREMRAKLFEEGVLA